MTNLMSPFHFLVSIRCIVSINEQSRAVSETKCFQSILEQNWDTVSKGDFSSELDTTERGIEDWGNLIQLNNYTFLIYIIK